jgi:KUP system potassium uptake protein
MSDHKSTDHTHSIFSIPFVLTVISACGVVYGDIGTSVLYTFREIFFGHETYGQVPITQDHILGAVSLVFWSLVLLVTIKYSNFVLYADHNGEGGTFALLAQLKDATFFGKTILTGFFLILSAGFLFGEGLITPAISILAAVEGLEEITDQFEPVIVWLAAGILLALFSVQRKGTAKVGL